MSVFARKDSADKGKNDEPQMHAYMTDEGIENLTPLQKAHLALKQKRESGDFAVERLNPVERAKRNPNSLRAAITAHCYQCCGAGADPNVRQTIRDCGILDCSLHHLRPYQKSKGKSVDQLTEEEIEAGQDEETDYLEHEE